MLTKEMAGSCEYGLTTDGDRGSIESSERTFRLGVDMVPECCVARSAVQTAPQEQHAGHRGAAIRHVGSQPVTTVLLRVARCQARRKLFPDTN